MENNRTIDSMKLRELIDEELDRDYDHDDLIQISANRLYRIIEQLEQESIISTARKDQHIRKTLPLPKTSTFRERLSSCECKVCRQVEYHELSDKKNPTRPELPRKYDRFEYFDFKEVLGQCIDCLAYLYEKDKGVGR